MNAVVHGVVHGIGPGKFPTKTRHSQDTGGQEREREEEKRETRTPDMMGGRTITYGNEEGWPRKESDEKDRSKGSATTEE